MWKKIFAVCLKKILSFVNLLLSPKQIKREKPKKNKNCIVNDLCFIPAVYKTIPLWCVFSKGEKLPKLVAAYSAARGGSF